ncbi:hypothetical protein QM340_30435, partial [Pseudomonas aeruginosa]|nr:hypothetical protein [Pseudomonas aeruginosa]
MRRGRTKLSRNRPAALLVSACQGNASSQPTPVVAPQAQPADPYAELQETLAAGKLEQAEQQWLALRSAAARTDSRRKKDDIIPAGSRLVKKSPDSTP